MIISSRLKQILRDTDNKLLRILMKTRCDIDYIDISHTDMSMISYITTERIKRLKDKYQESYENHIWKENRYDIKIGKFIKQILNIQDSYIEIIVNKYKSIIDEDLKFRVVKGIDIKIFFYHKNTEERGSIGSSCMRYQNSQRFLDIYSDNSNISLLVLIKKGKTVGRSLLWQTVEGYNIMDRTYTSYDYYDILFGKWANENNYYKRSSNKWYVTDEFTYNGKTKKLKISVKLDKFTYKYYPYLDTFKWLDYKNGYMYNYIPDVNVVTLIGTNGSVGSKSIITYDGLLNRYDYTEFMGYCRYKNIWTRKSLLQYSPINRDYIIDGDHINDSVLGVIYGGDFYKMNNKKMMLKHIIDKVSTKRKKLDINKNDFLYYKSIFEDIKNNFPNDKRYDLQRTEK